MLFCVSRLEERAMLSLMVLVLELSSDTVHISRCRPAQGCLLGKRTARSRALVVGHLVRQVNSLLTKLNYMYRGCGAFLFAWRLMRLLTTANRERWVYQYLTMLFLEKRMLRLFAEPHVTLMAKPLEHRLHSKRDRVVGLRVRNLPYGGLHLVLQWYSQTCSL